MNINIGMLVGNAIIILFIYILVFSIIDRICRCFERCAYVENVDKVPIELRNNMFGGSK